MPAFYGYTDVLLGSQTSAGVGGVPIDYGVVNSGSWSYAGRTTSFILEEARNSNTTFNGDVTNEVIANNIQIGANRLQTVEIGGIDRQVIWDYTFTVSSDKETWRVAVIDVDLDNSDTIDPGSENGYFLVFPDGLPPVNTNLTFGPIVENDNGTSHSGLGATVVCFAAGTLIETFDGLTAVEKLVPGYMVVTRDNGVQPLRWIGKACVPASGDLAPIVISKRALGNEVDLVLSPQHAVLLSDWRAEYCFGEDVVLIRAIDLLRLMAFSQRTGGVVTYCHILCDKHQLVSAASTWSESLYPGDFTRNRLNPTAQAEIEVLFPDMIGDGQKAVRCQRSFEARCIAA